MWIERSECDAKGCESGDKPQKFSQRRGMCPSCHDVEGNSAVRCNESLHDPAPLAGNENPQDCHSVHHLQSAKKVYGMPGRALEIGCKLGEEKNCMGPFTNDKQ